MKPITMKKESIEQAVQRGLCFFTTHRPNDMTFVLRQGDWACETSDEGTLSGQLCRSMSSNPQVAGIALRALVANLENRGLYTVTEHNPESHSEGLVRRITVLRKPGACVQKCG